MRKLLLAVGFIAAGLTATGAIAQTTPPPYPGGPTTTAPSPTSAFQDLGTKPVPSTFDISFCQFIGQTESTVDESQGDSQQAGINNCVTKSIELSFATGTALAAGGPLAATNFAQTAPQVRIRVNGRLYPTKPLGFTHTITVRGTGTNGAARTVTAIFRTVRAGSTTTRSGLARTGTFAVQYAPLGVGLVGLGYLLVLATRRRRTV